MKPGGSRNVSSGGENRRRRGVWRNWKGGVRKRKRGDGQKTRRGGGRTLGVRLLGTRSVGDAPGGRAREGGVSARRRHRHSPGFCPGARSISSRHPAALCTRTLRSRVCGSQTKAGVAADCGAAGRPRSPPLRHSCLRTPGSWGTRRSPRKAAKWRAVSPVEGPGWVPAG